MLKTITRFIIACASLWLALPAAAQFEIDPDHFDDPVPTVVQSGPEQPKELVRTSLLHKQVRGRRMQAFNGTKSPVNTLQKWSSAADVKHHGISRTSRVGQGSANRKRSEKSRLVSGLSCTSSEGVTSAYHGKHTHCGL